MIYGYVYRMVSPNTGRTYIGSTTSDPKNRISVHKSSYRNWLKGDCLSYICRSKDILRDIDWFWEVIAQGEFESRKELRKAEAYWMGFEPNKLVNKNNCGGIEDFKKYHSEYYRNNKHKRVHCECGQKVAYFSLTSHKKTKKHSKEISD